MRSKQSTTTSKSCASWRRTLIGADRRAIVGRKRQSVRKEQQPGRRPGDRESFRLSPERHDEVVHVDPLIMGYGIQAAAEGGIEPDGGPMGRLVREEQHRP